MLNLFAIMKSKAENSALLLLTINLLEIIPKYRYMKRRNIYR